MFISKDHYITKSCTFSKRLLKTNIYNKHIPLGDTAMFLLKYNNLLLVSNFPVYFLILNFIFELGLNILGKMCPKICLHLQVK